MLKLAAALMLTATVMAIPARAGDIGMPELTRLTRQVGTNYMISSMWFEMLEHVATSCDQRIDKATLMLWNDRMGREGIMSVIVERFRGGTSVNYMDQDWVKAETADHAGACAFALSLWGQDGDQFPGVLRPR